MSNPEERACSRPVGPTCKYLISTLHYWWCDNDACCQARGTKRPGIKCCPYYRPVYKSSQPGWENLLLAGLLGFYIALTGVLVWSLI